MASTLVGAADRTAVTRRVGAGSQQPVGRRVDDVPLAAHEPGGAEAGAGWPGPPRGWTGAPTAASTPMSATTAFCTISKPIRPLTQSSGTAGERPASTRAPTTLSTALCRPTSSRTTSERARARRTAPRRAGRRWSRRPAAPRGAGPAGPAAPRRAPRRSSQREEAAHVAHRQHVVDALGAADPAGRRGGRQPGVPLGRGLARRPAELDGHDVELLLGGERHVGAVGDGAQVLGRGEHALGVQEAGGQLEVVPGVRIVTATRSAGTARPGQPDLQRFLGGQPVLVPADRPVGAGGDLVHADACAGPRATVPAHGQQPIFEGNRDRPTGPRYEAAQGDREATGMGWRRRSAATAHDDWTSEVSSGLALAGFLFLVFIGFTLLAMGPLISLDAYFNLAPPPPGWVPFLHVLDRIGQRAVCLPILAVATFVACRYRETWRPVWVVAASVFSLNLLRAGPQGAARSRPARCGRPGVLRRRDGLPVRAHLQHRARLRPGGVRPRPLPRGEPGPTRAGDVVGGDAAVGDDGGDVADPELALVRGPDRRADRRRGRAPADGGDRHGGAGHGAERRSAPAAALGAPAAAPRAAEAPLLPPPAAGRRRRSSRRWSRTGMRPSRRGAVTAVLLVVAVRLLGLVVLAAAAARDGRSAHARLVRWDSQWYAGIARSGYGHTVLHPDGRHLSDYAFFPLYPAAGAGRLRADRPGVRRRGARRELAGDRSWRRRAIYAVGARVHGVRAGIVLAVLWAALPGRGRDLDGLQRGAVHRPRRVGAARVPAPTLAARGAARRRSPA